jgi:hypothetical protein
MLKETDRNTAVNRREERGLAASDASGYAWLPGR